MKYRIFAALIALMLPSAWFGVRCVWLDNWMYKNDRFEATNLYRAQKQDLQLAQFRAITTTGEFKYIVPHGEFTACFGYEACRQLGVDDPAGAAQLVTSGETK